MERSDQMTPSELPTDSDIEVEENPRGTTRPDHLRPVHLHWRYIGLVALGGAFGTAARYLLTASVPVWEKLPLTTLGVNIIGAFALGALLEGLLRRGHDVGFRRTLRLLAGTGFLGGFTTYSTLAVDTDTLIRQGQPWVAVGYAAATLVLGAAASAVGIILASRNHRVRHPEAYRVVEEVSAQ